MAQMNPKDESDKLVAILKERKESGSPVEMDVATHALLLISNGWPACDALSESQRTLADAELEGGY